MHRLGPENGTLWVRTGRTGAAAKAGHDLRIEVTAWEATLEVGEGAAPHAVTLTADATSLRVREGTGGMQALDDDDRSNIQQTIDNEVLRREDIVFRSSEVRAGTDGSFAVEGDLTLAGTTRPISFEIAAGDDGTVRGRAVVKQTDWDMKPYSALFGALKVADEAEVGLDARLPGQSP
jgi:polyisoprenoid-binding protein YceI